MGDWADEKAREWLNLDWASAEWDDGSAEASLAALLREVEGDALARGAADGHDLGKEDTLAEVRRVVEDVQKSIWGAPTDEGSAVTLCCSEILSRLEKL
jgi:hypothetical protein